MRTLDEILSSIENAKLDVPSNEYLQVKMEDLENLYNNIKYREELTRIQEIKIESLEEKVKLLNELATMKHKRLDTYS